MRRKLRALYEGAALGFGLGLLGLVCVVWWPFGQVFYRVLPRASGGRIGRLYNMVCFRFYLWALSAAGLMRFDIDAIDALRVHTPVIIAPNHPRLLDAVLFISRLPNVVCIMKDELMHNFFLGTGARLAGYIGNKSLAGMIRDSVETLHAGNHLLLFPEGTRTVREPVNPFTAAVGLIAARGNVPVQTVFIECDSKYLGKGWPLFRRPSLPITFRVRLGRQFEPPADVRIFTHMLEAYFTDELTVAAALPETGSRPAYTPSEVAAKLANPT